MGYVAPARWAEVEIRAKYERLRRAMDEGHLRPGAFDREHPLDALTALIAATLRGSDRALRS